VVRVQKRRTLKRGRSRQRPAIPPTLVQIGISRQLRKT